MKKLKLTVLAVVISLLTIFVAAACTIGGGGSGSGTQTLTSPDTQRFNTAVSSLQSAGFEMVPLTASDIAELDFEGVVRASSGVHLLNFDLISVYQFTNALQATSFKTFFLIGAEIMGIDWPAGRNGAVVYIGDPAAVEIVRVAIGGTVTSPGGGENGNGNQDNPNLSADAIAAAFEAQGWFADYETVAGITIVFAFSLDFESEFMLSMSNSQFMADIFWDTAGDEIADAAAAGITLTRARQGWWVWYGTADAMAIFTGLL